MLQINTILHPTDFSACAKAALAHAIRLSRQHDAELHVMHVAPTFGDDPLHGIFEASVEDEDFYQELWDEADQEMQAMLDEHQDEGVTFKRVLSRGMAPGPVLLEYAESEDIDVVVMGTHGRRGLRHMVLGSVAEEVVRKAACPVFTVRTRDDAESEVAPVERVLVPVDFSTHAREAVRYGKELARLYEAPLAVLHVVGQTPYPAFYDPGIVTIPPELSTKAKDELKTFYEGVGGPDVPADVHVVEGYPAREIIAFSQQYDHPLLVMATHGLTGLKHFLFGSVAEKVVRGADCPVFTVRAFGKKLVQP